eukprot:jgi/Mesen1/9566/ME000644S08864
MEWLPKVSLGNLGDLAGAVNKLSESVKNIEKNFDTSFGFDGGSATKAECTSKTEASQSLTEVGTDAAPGSTTSVLTPVSQRLDVTSKRLGAVRLGGSSSSDLGPETKEDGKRSVAEVIPEAQKEDAAPLLVPKSSPFPDVSVPETMPVPPPAAPCTSETEPEVDATTSHNATEQANLEIRDLTRTMGGASETLAEVDDTGDRHAQAVPAPEQSVSGDKPDSTVSNDKPDLKVPDDKPDSARRETPLPGLEEGVASIEPHDADSQLPTQAAPSVQEEEHREVEPDEVASIPPTNTSQLEKEEGGKASSVGEAVPQSSDGVQGGDPAHLPDELNGEAEGGPPGISQEQTKESGNHAQEEERGDHVSSAPSQIVVDQISTEEGQEHRENRLVNGDLGYGALEVQKLKKDLQQMEISLQAAAIQSQVKADELARYMAMNDELKAQIEELKGKKPGEAELDALREEYQHRLGAAERKVYALTKERDMLRREQGRKSDSSALLKEKDEIIKQVMAEGEELSKKQATQEGHMKKLRTQIRELEEEKQRLNSRLQVEEARVESIRKDKAATEKALQDVVERGQAELASQKDYFSTALSEAKAAQAAAESKADSDARADLDRRLRESAERERTLAAALDDLRQALSRSEQQAAWREDRLRRDLDEKEKRCQEAEARHEDLVARMPDSTRPLLRQIQAMQEAASLRAEAINGVEQALSARLQDAEAKAAAAEERERASTERLTQMLSRMAVLEAQLGCLRSEQAQLQRSLDKERQRAAESRQDYLAAQEAAATHEGRAAQLEEDLKDLRARHRKELSDERHKRDALSQKMDAERAATAEYEKRARSDGRVAAEKAMLAGAAPHHHASSSAAAAAAAAGGRLRRMSSTSSAGSSMDDAAAAAAAMADGFPASSSRPSTPSTSGQPGLFHSSSGKAHNHMMMSAASLQELESLLRHKEGELVSYSSRLSALESTRDSLAEELVSTSQLCEVLRLEAAAAPGLRAELEALRRRHASALELMGERDEQVEELRADLQDVKEMYRDQIDMLVNQIQQISIAVGTK